MSNFSPINLIISLLAIISVIAIGIFIQIKLSRSKNKYLGIIMPILFFLLSIMAVLSISIGTVMLESNVNYLGMFVTFLIGNIPTIILGGVYLNERNKIGIKNL